MQSLSYRYRNEIEIVNRKNIQILFYRNKYVWISFCKWKWWEKKNKPETES